MSEPKSQKEHLLMMLTEIYDQLEEMEVVLQTSFSDLRFYMDNKEMDKLVMPARKISALEHEKEMLLGEGRLGQGNLQHARPTELKFGF
jgi:hypothetical protein